MSFWKKLFKPEEEVRALTHPKQLKVGDVICFDDSYALPTQLRGETFTVKQINTYEFEEGHDPEFVLKGSGSATIYLAIDDEDEEYVAISMGIPRSKVEQLFDLDEFAKVFDQGTGLRLIANNTQEDLLGWVAQSYVKPYEAEVGYYYDQQDYRGTKPPQDDDSGEELRYYCLVDDNEDYEVEIEVWDDGETDIALTIYRPIRDIKELWPAKDK